MTLSLILSLIGLAVPQGALGQQLPELVRSAGLSRAARTAVDTVPYRRDSGWAGLGAVLGGGVGLVAGFAAGAALAQTSRCGDDLCGLGQAITGALVGEALGVGLGAHLGNKRRGNGLATVAASVGVLITALVVNDHAGLPQNAIVFVPMVQIAAAVIVETVVGRARNGSHER